MNGQSPQTLIIVKQLAFGRDGRQIQDKFLTQRRNAAKPQRENRIPM
jgi:hypothetical protein